MANVGDCSGWMFYLWFMGSQRPWRKNLVEQESPVEIVKKVVISGIQLTPGHEAMWGFVRGCAIGMEGVLSAREQGVITEMIRGYLLDLEGENEWTEAKRKDLSTLKRCIRAIEHLQAH